MNRLPDRTGSLAARFILIIGLLAAQFGAASADDPSLWYQGTRLIFARTDNVNGDLAVSWKDSGLAKFLGKIGATIAWQPGERYIVVTSSDHRVILLTLGDTAITAAGITSRAPFAPFADGRDAFIPFMALARALYVEPVAAGDVTVLQPQLAVMNVRKEGPRTVVSLRGPGVLKFRRLADVADRLELQFPGLGSALGASRSIAAPGLEKIDIASSGSPKNPVTTVAFAAPPGSAHQLLASDTPSQLIIAFGPQGVALDVPGDAGVAKTVLRTPAYVPPSPPAPSSFVSPSPQAFASGAPTAASAGGATITAIETEPVDDGATVRISFTGSSQYEWHRLNVPEARFYVDIHNARLAIPVRDDQVGTPAVEVVRYRQFTSDTVRVTVVLSGPKRVDITSGVGFLALTAKGGDDLDVVKAGTGTLGTPAVAYNPQGPVPSMGPSAPADWKFGTPAPLRPMSANPRLIVIDPGHGGSDPGAQNTALGLREKDLTFDISERLRDLLVAQGWQVKMTRASDVDVFAPNASDRDELQARCDVANDSGARMFVSVHINSYTSSALNGTTTYYYKDSDKPLAEAVQQHLIALLGTKDDGVRKDNFYVIHHTTMPATLVETAFLSNPSDAQLLRSPSFLQRVAQAIADGINQYSGGPSSAPAQTSMDQ